LIIPGQTEVCFGCCCFPFVLSPGVSFMHSVCYDLSSTHMARE
jgi:hypothetical protein